MKINHYLRALILTFLFLFLVTSCGGKNIQFLDNEELFNSEWTLVSLIGNNTKVSGKDLTVKPTIQFIKQANGTITVNGFSGINRFMGGTKIVGTTITPGNLATTRMAGSPEASKIEDLFLSIINHGGNYSIFEESKTKYMSIKNDVKKTELLFESGKSLR